MDPGEERIGINGAAVILGRPVDDVQRYVEEGRLDAETDSNGNHSFLFSEVEALGRELEIEDAEEEVFEGEVVGDESTEGSRLPAVPFERYERLLQQGQDYKTRLEERNRQVGEIRRERDAARVEMDRLWDEIERLNLIEFQSKLQEKTISTLEEEKAKLEATRERLTQKHEELIEEKASIAQERTRLEAEYKVLKNRGFFSRIFGG